jgi:hypothetical protein
MVRKSLNAVGISIEEFLKTTIDDSFLSNLAMKITSTWENGHCADRPWASNKDAVERILRMGVSKKPQNFIVGVTDRAFPATDKYPPSAGEFWVPILASLMEKMLLLDGPPINALVFRTWAVNGTFHEFVTKIKSKRIVLVGPSHLATLGYKLNFPDFTYLPIHDTEALLHLDETKKRILDVHNEQPGKEVIYFFVGGSAAMWLISELHGRLDKSFLIDIGRAFDPYYYYDPIKKQTPKWMWGGWLDRRNPTWVKKTLKRDKDGIYCTDI